MAEFSGLGVEEINGVKLTQRYKKGQILFRQESPPHGVFIVQWGRVKAVRFNEAGTEAIFRLAGPGAILGHKATFTDRVHSATAVALEEVSVCFFFSDRVRDILGGNPDFSQRVIQLLGRELAEVEMRLASLSQKNVRERLVHGLLFLKESFGEPDGDGYKLNIHLTRTELAALIGVTPETVIRMLSDLKKKGAIGQSGRAICIRDEEELKNFVC